MQNKVLSTRAMSKATHNCYSQNACQAPVVRGAVVRCVKRGKAEGESVAVVSSEGEDNQAGGVGGGEAGGGRWCCKACRRAARVWQGGVVRKRVRQ